MIKNLVYDVGMHKGEDSAFYLAKGYEVVGLEANPDLMQECRMRFAGEDRITLIEGAVTDRNTPTVPLYRYRVSGWGTISESRNEFISKAVKSVPVQVAAVDFAETLCRTGMPFYMKVDIEGADMVCIRTLADFEDRPRYVSMESTKTDWQDLMTELSTLEQLGYDRFAVVQQANIGGSEILTETIEGQPLRYHFEEWASGPFGSDLEGWTDRAGAEEKYRRIFRAYESVGNRSRLRRTKAGRELLTKLSESLGPLPGWYDTHAARD